MDRIVLVGNDLTIITLLRCDDSIITFLDSIHPQITYDLTSEGNIEIEFHSRWNSIKELVTVIHQIVDYAIENRIEYSYEKTTFFRFFGQPGGKGIISISRADDSIIVSYRRNNEEGLTEDHYPLTERKQKAP